MKTQPARTFRASVESLEAREVLSGGHATAHLASLQGHGSAQVFSQQAFADGSVEAIDNTQGSAASLGPYDGVFTITLAPDRRHVSGDGNFVTANGELDYTFTGSYQLPRGHSSIARGQFHLTFQGGTDAFSNASGNGTLTLLNDLSRYSAIYTTSGKFRI